MRHTTRTVAQRSRIYLVAVLLSCSVAGPSGQARPREHSPQFGIVAFDLSASASTALLQLAVGLVRGSCTWESLEPARGTFDWDCSDNVIVGAQRLGLRSYLTVVCTPGWANGGRGCQSMPTDLVDWYQFVASFVSRYAKFQTVLGVWNEPNLELNDDAAGSNYALLFVNASNARHAVNPQFVLAGPETSHHALQSGYFSGTMDLIQSNRALDVQDIVSVHWYADGPPLFDYLDNAHDVVRHQDVWLSETGYRSTDPGAQAAFYGGVLNTFAMSGRPWWTHVIFYRLWDGTDCCSEAIVGADYRPKPAFTAYSNWLLQPRAVPRPAS